MQPPQDEKTRLEITGDVWRCMDEKKRQEIADYLTQRNFLKNRRRRRAAAPKRFRNEENEDEDEDEDDEEDDEEEDEEEDDEEEDEEEVVPDDEDEEEDEEEEDNKEEIPEIKSNLTCSVCKQKGHRSSNCPQNDNKKPRKKKKKSSCTSCGAEGHTSRNKNCPNYDPKKNGYGKRGPYKKKKVEESDEE